MPIVTGKTPSGLVKHAQKALNEKWWYVWGTFGNKLTESLLESKAKQYPTYNGGANKAIHRKHLGQTACDCVGLIKGYCMWNDKTNKPVYRSDLDYNTGMMYNAAKVKGPIGTIPDRAGICVYMQGHVGVYIGDGWVIECAGGRGASELLFPEAVLLGGQHGLNVRSSITAALRQKNHPPAAPFLK